MRTQKNADKIGLTQIESAKISVKSYCANLRSKIYGVTLIEMLVVILILGLLFAVAFRTIDATTYQSRFNATTKEMSELVKAFVGNPDLVSDGRRINFGYVGDQGQLPTSLSALITSDGGNWKGPYVPRQFIEDTTGFKTDAWGDTYVYQYDQYNASIKSIGGGKQTLTMKIADSITDLFNNRISGTITDINGAPPAEFSQKVNIRLTIPKDGYLVDTSCTPRADGYFEFSPVPIGYHRMVVTKQFGTRDSVVRWVSVLPRSNIVAEFRFPTSFRNNLKYVEGSGAAYAPVGDTIKNNIGFSVFNSGDSITLDSMVVISIKDDTGMSVVAFYEEVDWEGIKIWDYLTPPPHRNGVGDIAEFSPQPGIGMHRIARVDIKGFKDEYEAPPTGNPVNMRGKRIAIKFSDGSVIDFVPQTSP